MEKGEIVRKEKESKSGTVTTEIRLSRELSVLCTVRVTASSDDETLAHGVAAVFDTFHRAISMYPDYPTRVLFIRVVRAVACVISGTLDEAMEGKIAAAYLNNYGTRPFQQRSCRASV